MGLQTTASSCEWLKVWLRQTRLQKFWVSGHKMASKDTVLTLCMPSKGGFVQATSSTNLLEFLPPRNIKLAPHSALICACIGNTVLPDKWSLFLLSFLYFYLHVSIEWEVIFLVRLEWGLISKHKFKNALSGSGVSRLGLCLWGESCVIGKIWVCFIVESGFWNFYLQGRKMKYRFRSHLAPFVFNAVILPQPWRPLHWPASLVMYMVWFGSF